VLPLSGPWGLGIAAAGTALATVGTAVSLIRRARRPAV
jgi:hypothetical protein